MIKCIKITQRIFPKKVLQESSCKDWNRSERSWTITNCFRWIL